MSSRLAFQRVVLARDDFVDPSQREVVRLRDGPHGENAATDFTATTLPASMSRRQLVRRVKQCSRTERVCEGRQGRAWAGPPRGRLLPRLEPPRLHGGHPDHRARIGPSGSRTRYSHLLRSGYFALCYRGQA
jgi:hypothetical protein